MVPLRLIAGLAAIALTANANASPHGGQYRGPFPGIPRARQPVAHPPSPGPRVGGPTTPRAPSMPTAPAVLPGPSGPLPTPTTGAGTGTADLSPDTVDWRTWWEFNKDPFLEQRSAAQAAPVTGSDDFYIGTRRSEARFDVLELTDDDRRDRIVPALHRLIDDERQRDVQSACLIALGKLGMDAPGVDLDAVIAQRIARDDQEVRETAVLALGIAGRASALPKLAALLGDDEAGRRMVGRRVDERTRAFAAYALGLCARASDDAAQKQQVHDLLWGVLQDRKEQGFEVRTAAVTGLGLLRGDVAGARHLRIAWQTVDELLAWFERDLGAGDELVQAHAPIAIARLLGRGTSTAHQRCKQRFAAAFAQKPKRGVAILQSAALALGMLCVPEEPSGVPSSRPRNEDEASAKALVDFYGDGVDRQARYFALLALGRIGGAANRERLRDVYAHSRRSTDRSWAALALGLCVGQAAALGEIDQSSGRLLLGDLEDEPNDERRGALAIAIGLAGYTPAVPRIQRILQDEENRTELAGYLCVALALLGDRSSTPQLQAIVERSLRRPTLLQQAAVALGRLGDRDTNNVLLSMLGKSESTATLAALAQAIGQIGDRRAIEPLVAMSADANLTQLARAFVAAALGGVGDKQALPFNVPISVDCNYAANVDTLTNGASGILDIL